MGGQNEDGGGDDERRGVLHARGVRGKAAQALGSTDANWFGWDPRGERGRSQAPAPKRQAA